MKLFRKGFWPKALVAILVLLQFAAVLVLFLYLLNLTSRHLSKRKRSKFHNKVKNIVTNDNLSLIKEDDTNYYNMASVVENITLAPISKNTKFTFFSDGIIPVTATPDMSEKTNKIKITNFRHE